MVPRKYHIYYCGLFFKLICTSNIDDQNTKKNVKKIDMKKIRNKHILEREIASGGRYDNQVSHFDKPTLISNVFAVGVSINITEIVDALNIEKEEKSRHHIKIRNRVDVWIYCDKTNKKNKEQWIQLLTKFWKKGVKTIIDFKHKKTFDI